MDYVGDNKRYEVIDGKRRRIDSSPGATHIQRPINKDMKVRLAHFSVKEYLESTRILGSKVSYFHLENAVGHRFLAQSCLTYIFHYSRSSEKSSTTKDLVNFPLLKYAARSWPSHSQLQQCHDVTREVSLLTSMDAMRNWLLVARTDQRGIAFESIGELGSGIYYASFLGLDTVVRDLVERGADVDAQAGNHGNALYAASYQGYADVVRSLLEKGADINAGALTAAFEEGHAEIVRLLLEKGADINAGALAAASKRGHIEIIQLLLEKRANVNAYKALHAAAARGYTEIVRLLLEKGAGADTGSVLYAASQRGDVEIVRLLLDKGADVNAEANFEAAYRLADDRNYYAGKHLLREKADAMKAASSQYAEIVRLLFEKGADDNRQGEECRRFLGAFHRNALEAASRNGHTEVVQLLRDAGARSDDEHTVNTN
ncbi:hypothetical protein BST61_g1332 [Cercospora zeina]